MKRAHGVKTDVRQVDYSEAAVTRRLREVERLRRLQFPEASAVDMSEQAVTARLREVEALRRLCVELAER